MTGHPVSVEVERAVRADASAAGFALDPPQEQALPLLAGLAAGRPGGAYLHGPPGRGKSWLVDAVLRAALPAGVLRAHSHALYARLHAATGRRYAAGRVEGAYAAAVDTVLDGVRLLVVDELHLTDSDDAWIAERLLGRVLDRGGALVVTSNTPADRLHDASPHADGLRALLRARTTSFAFDGGVDHRLHAPAADRPAFSAGAFLSPGTSTRLADLGLSRPGAHDRVTLQVGGRPLEVAGADEDGVWVSFRALCERPTATGDYVELADRYRTWVVVGVPPLAVSSPHARARFTHVVDVAHDRDVRLVLVGRQGLDETAGPAGLLPPRLLSRLELLRRPPAPVQGGVVTRTPFAQRVPQRGARTSARTSATPS